jgi:hypothetical protein
MHSFVDYSKVPDEYRLSFVVGEIVRNDVFAENETKALHNKLRVAGLTDEHFERDFGRVLPQVLKILESPRVPEPFRKIAAQVVNKTQRAHAVRRDTVHDALTQMPFELDEIGSGFGRPSRRLTTLEKCADDLKEVTWRLRAVWVIAPQWIGGPLDGWETAARLRSWTRVAMGHIADLPNEIRGTSGKSPEPPGGFRVDAPSMESSRSSLLSSGHHPD